MKSLLSVLSVTVLVAPPCALAGIVVRASEQARRAKDPRRPGAGRSNRPGARRPQAGRVAIHCDRGRRASCRSTRSARRHEGTEEVESWFTRTSVMDCFVPRLGMARSLSDAPPASAPTLVGARVPRARPAPRLAVGHPAHGAGRRGRRPLPPILPRRGPAREVPAPPSARGVRTGSAREGLAPPRHRAVRRWRGTARRDRFVVDEKAAFARRGGNGAGVTRKGGRVL